MYRVFSLILMFDKGMVLVSFLCELSMVMLTGLVLSEFLLDSSRLVCSTTVFTLWHVTMWHSHPVESSFSSSAQTTLHSAAKSWMKPYNVIAFPLAVAAVARLGTALENRNERRLQCRISTGTCSTGMQELNRALKKSSCVRNWYAARYAAYFAPSASACARLKPAWDTPRSSWLNNSWLLWSWKKRTKKSAARLKLVMQLERSQLWQFRTPPSHCRTWATTKRSLSNCFPTFLLERWSCCSSAVQRFNLKKKAGRNATSTWQHTHTHQWSLLRERQLQKASEIDLMCILDCRVSSKMKMPTWRWCFFLHGSACFANFAIMWGCLKHGTTK